MTYRASVEALTRSPTLSSLAAGARTSSRSTSRRRRLRATRRRGERRFGRLDVWVNNAGADVSPATPRGDWERKLDLLLAVDLKGTMACCYAAARAMQTQPSGGHLINMSWDHVTVGMAGENPQLFAAVKGGVLAFSKSLARALAPEVRVNVLCPGWIETSFGEQADRDFHRSVAQDTPLRRWGRPQDVAEAAVYLASPEAAFLTGQAINVNGGVVM